MEQRQGAKATRRLAAGVALAICGAAIGPAPALAGKWMQAICQNPDGSSAPIEGWSSAAPGAYYASFSSCPAGGPLSAAVAGANPVGATAEWTYTPPAGATIAGGHAYVTLRNGNGGYSWLGYPNNVIAVCQGDNPCADGTVSIPANGQVSDLVLGATCAAASNTGTCTTAQASLRSALILLATSLQPTGSSFAGSLLSGSAHGTASLTFTAADPGPGVYKVIVSIDGQQVYVATPSANNGWCQAAGVDPGTGAAIFDHQQPCPRSIALDIAVDTTSLRDGQHDVQVQVQDAAQNTATVLDQTISTDNLTSMASKGKEQLPASAGATGAVYALRLDPATEKLAARALRSRYGHSSVTLTGTVLNDAGAPAPGVPVTVQAAALSGGAPQTIARATTDAAGRFSITVPRGDSRELQLSAGTGEVAIKQYVSPSITLHATALSGHRVLFTGKVAIAPNGNPRPLVELEVYDPTASHKWGLFATVTAAKNGTFRYVYGLSPLLTGYTFAFHAVTPATGSWQTATSAARTARIR
jgi:hypothetical protein